MKSRSVLSIIFVWPPKCECPNTVSILVGQGQPALAHYCPGIISRKRSTASVFGLMVKGFRGLKIFHYVSQCHRHYLNQFA